MINKVWVILDNPKIMAKIHGWAGFVWLLLAIATTSFALYYSDNRYLLAWVIFMSGYANAAAHWGARQGAAPSVK